MGLWPFFLKRTVQTKGIIKVSHESALATLQDAPTMITLNPLVVHHEIEPADPSTYHITDNIKVLSWTIKTEYTARAETLDDGIIFHVNAGGGMSSVNFWRSRPCEEERGTVEVLEEANIEAFFLFLPMIVGTIKRSHQTLMENLRIKLEGIAQVVQEGDEK